jgi:antitoxin Phd
VLACAQPFAYAAVELKKPPETSLRNYALDEARAVFSELVDRALAGEPQRITRFGEQAVVVVSEADWLSQRRSAATLGDLLANFAEGSEDAEIQWARSPFKQTRPLGVDFWGDEELPTSR